MKPEPEHAVCREARLQGLFDGHRRRFVAPVPVDLRGAGGLGNAQQGFERGATRDDQARAALAQSRLQGCAAIHAATSARRHRAPTRLLLQDSRHTPAPRRAPQRWRRAARDCRRGADPAGTRPARCSCAGAWRLVERIEEVPARSGVELRPVDLAVEQRAQFLIGAPCAAGRPAPAVRPASCGARLRQQRQTTAACTCGLRGSSLCATRQYQASVPASVARAVGTVPSPAAPIAVVEIIFHAARCSRRCRSRNRRWIRCADPRRPDRGWARGPAAWRWAAVPWRGQLRESSRFRCRCAFVASGSIWYRLWKVANTSRASASALCSGSSCARRRISG